MRKTRQAKITYTRASDPEALCAAAADSVSEIEFGRSIYGPRARPTSWTATARCWPSWKSGHADHPRSCGTVLGRQVILRCGFASRGAAQVSGNAAHFPPAPLADCGVRIPAVFNRDGFFLSCRPSSRPGGEAASRWTGRTGDSGKSSAESYALSMTIEKIRHPD